MSRQWLQRFYAWIIVLPASEQVELGIELPAGVKSMIAEYPEWLSCPVGLHACKSGDPVLCACPLVHYSENARQALAHAVPVAKAIHGQRKLLTDGDRYAIVAVLEIMFRSNWMLAELKPSTYSVLQRAVVGHLVVSCRYAPRRLAYRSRPWNVAMQRPLGSIPPAMGLRH